MKKQFPKPKNKSFKPLPKLSKQTHQKTLSKKHIHFCIFKNTKNPKKSIMSSVTTTTFAFTPSVVISAGIEKALTSMAGDSMVALVHALAEKHGFDADETVRELGLSDIQVLKKKRVVKAPKEPKEKKVKEPKVPRDVPKCVVPWTGTPVDRDWCQAIKFSHGLYNQCTGERVADAKSQTGFAKFCKKSVSRALSVG